MPLPRSIETRLLEAVFVETIACFTDVKRIAAGQAAIGLDAQYGSKVYARPFTVNESVAPFQVNIVPAPPTWEMGTSGVSTTIYNVESAFVFPFDLVNLRAGANTFLDHLAIYRAWFFGGGTWPNKTAAIQDPDNPGHEVAHLAKFQQHEWLPAPNRAGLLIPVITAWETRETGSGVIA